jgi:type IV pilus assembly protein PilC
MAFRFQAVNKNGQTVSDTVEAGTAQHAAELLRERGLFVTRLEVDTGGSSAPTGPAVTNNTKAGGKLTDIVMFMQQMSMLLRAGARLVQAMEAIESQTVRPSWKKVVQAMRIEVEEGRPLSQALSGFPKLFPPIIVNMVAAGEASGNMGLAFERLSSLTRQQQDIRNRVVGAMTYPAVLMCMSMSVIVVMLTFVLPRFAEMFKALDVELPASTKILMGCADAVRNHGPLVIAALVGAVSTGIYLARTPSGGRFVSRAVVRIPVFGRIVRSIIFARICRVWGQLLDSKVGLLDAVRLIQQSTRSLDFQELLAKVAQAITEGQSIGLPFRESWLLPKTFAAAIVTGEESGKLADSLQFVASCLDEENAQVLSSLTRLIEPIMLVVMGVIVGTVAVSLFLPMFDMATVTGG